MEVIMLVSLFFVLWAYSKVGLFDYLEQVNKINRHHGGYWETPKYLKWILLFVLFGFFTGVGRDIATYLFER